MKTTDNNNLVFKCDQRDGKGSAIFRKTATTLVLAVLLVLLNACGLIGGNSTNPNYSSSNSGSPLAIKTTSLNSGVVGTPYTTSLAATGGTAPYTWNATGLPSGLSLNLSGAVSGTPSASGTFSISVKVSDATNKSASATLNLTIQVAGQLTITTALMPAATVTSAYSASLAASG